MSKLDADSINAAQARIIAGAVLDEIRAVQHLSGDVARYGTLDLARVWIVRAFSAVRDLHSFVLSYQAAIGIAEMLRAAIRQHRDARGDARCWLDDLRLYAALGDGRDPYGADFRLPPKDSFLESCARYWEQRQPELVAAVERYGITEPVAVDNEHKLRDAFQNDRGYVPAYYLFDAEGKLRSFAAGERGLGMLSAALDRTLAAR